jgi:hypothetical protein
MQNPHCVIFKYLFNNYYLGLQRTLLEKRLGRNLPQGSSWHRARRIRQRPQLFPPATTRTTSRRTQRPRSRMVGTKCRGWH